MTQHQSSAPEPDVNGRGDPSGHADTAGIMPFDLGGHQMRFGMTSDGSPWVAATDFAKALGYRNAGDALRNVDADEKGTQIVRTPGGDQQLSVLYEEGIWELIFISRRAEARTLKGRVKEILRKIRETGRYEASGSAPALPHDYEEALVHLLGKVRENKALAAENKVLAPKAEKWDRFCNADGLIDMTGLAGHFGLSAVALTATLMKRGVMRKREPHEGCGRIARKRYLHLFPPKWEIHNGRRVNVNYATIEGAMFVESLLATEAAS